MSAKPQLNMSTRTGSSRKSGVDRTLTREQVDSAACPLMASNASTGQRNLACGACMRSVGASRRNRSLGCKRSCVPDRYAARGVRRRAEQGGGSCRPKQLGKIEVAARRGCEIMACTRFHAAPPMFARASMSRVRAGGVLPRRAVPVRLRSSTPEVNA
jgi:hypothetical protein